MRRFVKRVLSVSLALVMIQTLFPLHPGAVQPQSQNVQLPSVTAEPLPASSAPVPQSFSYEEGQDAPALLSSVSDDSGFIYTVLDDTYCSISGYDGSAAELVIPDQIGGYLVQALSDEAFRGNTTLEHVTLPKTLETVGNYAFDGCTNLIAVDFNSEISYHNPIALLPRRNPVD